MFSLVKYYLLIIVCATPQGPQVCGYALDAKGAQVVQRNLSAQDCSVAIEYYTDMNDETVEFRCEPEV